MHLKVKGFAILLAVFMSSAAWAQSWDQAFKDLQTLYNQGDYAEAFKQAPEVMSLAQETYSKQHEAYVYSLHYGVLSAFQTQHNKQGIQWGEEEVRLMDQVKIPAQIKQNALNNLSQLYDAEGNTTKALDYTRKYLEAIQKVGEQRSVTYALGAYQLGTLCFKDQQFEKADSVFQQTLPVLKANLQQAGAQYINTLYYLGNIAFQQHRDEDAARYGQGLLDVLNASGLQDNPLWAQAHYQLGAVAQQNGQLQEAADHFKKVLKAKGADEALVKSAKHNLGVILEQMGRHDEATQYRDADEATTGIVAQAAAAFRDGNYDQAEALYQKAVQAAVDSADGPHIVQLQTQLAQVYQQENKWEKAKTVLQEAQDGADSLESKWQFYVAKAQSAYDLATFNYEDAGKHFEQATQLMEAAANIPKDWQVDFWNSKGVYLQQSGVLSAAGSAFEKAKQLAKETYGEQSAAYANALSNEGALQQSNGNYVKAEERYQQAATIYQKLGNGNRVFYAKTIESQATLAANQGNYAKADSLLGNAETLYQELLNKEDPQWIAFWEKQGDINLALAQYPEALKEYQEALTLSEKLFGEQSVRYGEALSSMAFYHQHIGNLQQAGAELKQVLKLYKKQYGKGHPAYITALENLSSIYQQLGEGKKALPFLQEALEADARLYGKQHPAYAATMHNLAALYLSQGELKKANALYDEVIKLDQKLYGANNPKYASSLYNYAVLNQKLEHYPQADSLFAAAASIRKKILGAQHPDYLYTLYGWALLKEVEQQPDSAYALLKEAVDEYQYLFEEYFPAMTEKEKSAFTQKVTPVFNAFRDFAITEAKHKPELVETLLNLQLNTKAMLLNSTEKIRKRILSSGNQTLIQEFKDWQHKKEEAIRYLSMTAEQRASSGIRLDSLEREISQMERALSETSQAFASEFNQKQLHWQDIQKALEPGQAMVEIVRVKLSTRNDSVVYAGIILSGQPESKPELAVYGNGKQLEGRFYNSYRNFVKFHVEDFLSYPNFWAWIKEKLPTDTKTIFFSPDGVYNKVSMASIYHADTKKYLLEEEDIRPITSARDLLSPRLHGDPFAHVTLIGAPKFQEKAQDKTWVHPLPGTAKEVSGIDSLLAAHHHKATILTGNAAKEETVDTLSSPSILHIATHGFFKQDNARKETDAVDFEQELQSNPLLKSGLLLCGANSSFDEQGNLIVQGQGDGILTAYETMNLSLDSTQLVVLSACETGLGEVQNGEGVYGLQRAFLVAGAENIIMSLWKVDDAVTRLLMDRFYQYWLDGNSKHQALKLAQLSVKKEYPDPYYWAAFTMIGK